MKGDIILFGMGSQSYIKMLSIRLWFPTPPHLSNNNFTTPLQYTLPLKQAKIELNSELSLLEQNKHTDCGHLVTPYILVVTNFCDSYPLFFFPMTPSIFRRPFPKKIIPLKTKPNTVSLFENYRCPEVDASCKAKLSCSSSFRSLYIKYKGKIYNMEGQDRSTQVYNGPYS